MDHQRPHIADQRGGLCPIRFETEILAQRTDGRLIPQLIRSPADQAELGMGRSRHAAPHGPDQDQLQIQLRLSRRDADT